MKIVNSLFLVLTAALGLSACGRTPERTPPPEPLVLGDVRAPDTVPGYLVICPEHAVGEIAPLARWRRAHGHTVRIAPAEMVYAAYGDGRPEAAGIRDFLRSLHARAPGRLKFVLLVGSADASNGEGMFLPTGTAPARFNRPDMPCDAVLAGDYLLASPAGTDQPEPIAAVGRLPARSIEQVRAMVAKTLRYEQDLQPGAWRRQVDIFAGSGGYGAIIDAFLERITGSVLADRVPNYVTIHVAYANPQSAFCYAPARFSGHVVERLNAGPAMAVYIGHGTETGFDSFAWKGRRYRILDPAAVETLQVPQHRTAMICLACSTGRFDGPLPSIGERLLAHPAGPAAFIGASRISQPYANAVLGGHLAEAFTTDPPATIGEAFLRVQQRLARGQVSGLGVVVDLMAATQLGFSALASQRGDQLILYNLLGDPALSTGVVRRAAELDAPTSARPGQDVRATVNAPVESGSADFSLTIRRDEWLGAMPAPAQTPHADDGEEWMVRRNAWANNKVVLQERLPLRDGRAVWEFRIPPALAGATVFVNVYVQGTDRDTPEGMLPRVAPSGPSLWDAAASRGISITDADPGRRATTHPLQPAQDRQN